MIALYVFVWLWLFYGLFTLVMGVYRAHLAKTLKWWHYLLLTPFVFVGLVMDLLSNLIIASIIFAEFPREALVTQRLKRYMSTSSYGWRYHWAQSICSLLLDPIDPTGNHCS